MTQFLQLILVLALMQTPALDSASPRERSDAVESMTVLGNRDAVPLLADAYKNERSTEIRTSIVRAFGRIRDQSAIPTLSEALLSDFQSDVRLQAVDSLLRLYIPVADERGFWDFITDVMRVFSEDEQWSVGPNVFVDEATKEVLVEALRNDFDREVRVAAANALGSLNATDQLPALIEELDGPRHREDWEVQIAMIRTMGAIASQDSGPVLTSLIRDEDERVAREAILSVGRTGYRTAFHALSSLFETSDDGDMRDLALESIGLLREPDAVNLFESLLESDEDSYRELSARGLARLDYDASSFVERFASEDDAEVRLAQAFALVAFGNSLYLQELVDALDSRRDQIAEVYLFELGRYEGRLEEFYPHLRNPDADIRAKLLGVVGRIGSPESRPYIQPLTQDSNTDVAEAAVEALRSLAP
jgi:HEAT repeat protein